jgi:carboxymethylenebutenolidase
MLVLTLALVASFQDPKPAPAAASQPAKEMGWTGVLGEKEFAALHDLEQRAPPKPKGTTVEVGADKHYLTLPEGKPPFPALLVIHEFWGLNDHIKHWADRLAADGYAALAVDLYGGVIAKDRDAASKAMQAVDRDKAERVLLAALKFLGADPRVQARKRGCIGWCFGGGWSLNLAIAAGKDLDASVIYYGRLVTDKARLEKIQAPILGVFGDRDRGIPPKSVEEWEAAMRELKKDVTVKRYDAEHAFANPSGQRYDEKNAAAAWAEVREFLRKRVKE